MTKRLDYNQIAPAGVKALGGVYGYVMQSGLPAVLVDLVYLRVSRGAGPRDFLFPTGRVSPTVVCLARAALDRSNVPAAAVSETIFGHARQAGGGPNTARQVSHRSGVPDSVPAQPPFSGLWPRAAPPPPMSPP